jgi:hypothetical protein
MARLIIEDPIPVVCHADLPGCHLRPENHVPGAAHSGPWYGPGSVWTFSDAAYAEAVAAAWRKRGYTVRVEAR